MTQLFNGVAKDKFEEWGIKNGYVITHTIYKNSTARIETSFNINFYKKPLREQIGVIEDFSESLGYLIWQGKDENFDGIIWNFLEIEKDGKILVNNHFETKKQLREEIIKELNNLINNHIVDTNKKV